MEDEIPRRNYIRKKKIYEKSYKLIRQTLELINLVKNVKTAPNELNKIAKQHANRVEAACWHPRIGLTDYDYQQSVIDKTQELCDLLINSYAPQVNSIRNLIQKNFFQNFKKGQINSPRILSSQSSDIKQDEKIDQNLSSEAEKEKSIGNQNFQSDKIETNFFSNVIEKSDDDCAIVEIDLIENDI